MRPINSGSSSVTARGSGIRVWNSPIPYLFGGLAVMLALISAALVVLICSYRKRALQSSAAAAQHSHTKLAMPKNSQIESEPKVVVIMAGDNNPTYLANLTTSSSYCTCEPHPSPSSSSISDQTN